MGIVIQAVIEDLYNNELYRHPEGLPKLLAEKTEKEFDYQLTKKRNYVDWNVAPPRKEMLQVCLDGVAGFLGTMKAHRLLGHVAKSEVDLFGYIDKYNPIGGRADNIVERKDTGITLFDGKNSAHRGKYVDADQLRWYALCYLLSYGKMPDRLAFLYFRFPYNEESGESGIEFIDFSKEDLQGLAKRAIKARRGMDKEKFEPTPSPQNCKFCDFETVCEARINQKASRRRHKPDALDDALDEGGFLELGF